MKRRPTCPRESPDSPRDAYLCLLVELLLYRPLGSAVWCNSPAGETFGSYP